MISVLKLVLRRVWDVEIREKKMSKPGKKDVEIPSSRMSKRHPVPKKRLKRMY